MRWLRARRHCQTFRWAGWSAEHSWRFSCWQPSKETAAALLVVALATYLTSAAFLAAPAAPVAHASRILSRPWDLLPAALFMVAAVCFRLRLKEDREKKSEATLFDYSIFIVAALNVICHVAAAF